MYIGPVKTQMITLTFLPHLSTLLLTLTALLTTDMTNLSPSPPLPPPDQSDYWPSPGGRGQHEVSSVLPTNWSNWNCCPRREWAGHSAEVGVALPNHFYVSEGGEERGREEGRREGGRGGRREIREGGRGREIIFLASIAPSNTLKSSQGPPPPPPSPSPPPPPPSRPSPPGLPREALTTQQFFRPHPHSRG